jgi:hypothetical protein
MYSVYDVSAIIRLAFVFVVILLAIRKRIALGNAFLSGAILIGLLYGAGIREILGSIVLSVLDPKALSLSVIVSLIPVLSRSMEISGHMRRLLKNFQGLVSDPRLNLVLFPAQLSPLHLCLLLSNKYFGVGMVSMYRHLWIPSVSVMAAGLVYFPAVHACMN